MPLESGAERLLRMLAASRGAPQPASVAERRRMLQTLTEFASAKQEPDGVAARDLQAPGPAGPIPMRAYTPAAASSAMMVYFHGGGWVAGGLDTHDGLCRRLAMASGANLLAVDYRLAPEDRFPAAFEDALAAVQWAAQQADALGFDAGRLGVGGDSVGAGLAAAVAQSPGAPPLALQLLICPILDVAGATPSRRAFANGFFVDAATLAQDLSDYCGAEVDLRDPRLSPMQARDLRRQPRALVHAAEYDPFRDEALAYAERLSQAGVSVRCTCWPGMIHYFYVLTRAIAGAGPAVEAIGTQIADALAGQA
jgi:acetyl esterase/lipase